MDFNELQDFSYSLWIKASNLENDIFPIYKGAGDINTAGYQLRIDQSDSLAYCRYTDGNGTGIESAVSTTTVAESNKWHHISCVMDRDGSETGLAGLHIFVDGILEGSDTTLTEGSSINTINLILGENATSREFNGSIDEVRIYNYALTQQQIFRDMNNI